MERDQKWKKCNVIGKSSSCDHYLPRAEPRPRSGPPGGNGAPRVENRLGSGV